MCSHAEKIYSSKTPKGIWKVSHREAKHSRCSGKVGSSFLSTSLSIRWWICAFFTLMRVCLCWLGSFRFFFNSKMHEIYEDCFFACVSKNIWLHKYIPLNPWAPTVFSTLLLCVNGSETERTVWRHYGIVERIQALGSDLGKNPRRAKQ